MFINFFVPIATAVCLLVGLGLIIRAGIGWDKNVIASVNAKSLGSTNPEAEKMLKKKQRLIWIGGVLIILGLLGLTSLIH